VEQLRCGCGGIEGRERDRLRLRGNDPYVGVDLDACIGDDGRLHPDANAVIAKLNSYTEHSPSGRGVHVIVRAKLNGSRNRTARTAWGGSFEAYGSSRFFTVTGNHVAGTPTTETRAGWREKERPGVTRASRTASVGG
jgi:primase-polymerase (primpol)-like protein